MASGDTGKGVASGAASGAATGTAILPGWGTAIGAVAGGILGGIGASQGNDTQGQAHNDEVQANYILQQLQNAPDISKPVILQQYKQAGILTPQMEQIINAQMPGVIQTSQAYADAQNNALNLMQQRANGGMTAADRAALTQAQQQVQTGTQGQLGAIQQQLQQQGLSDSGTSLAMKLSAAQNGANQQATNANQLAQQQQAARDQAAAQLGSYGSQLQQNQFNQAYQQQQAQQQMQRFNVQNQLGVNQRNAAVSNATNAANLANLQNVNNMNTQGVNNEQYNQLQRQLQQYGADVNLAQIKSGALNKLGGQEMGIGQQQSQGGYNQGVGMGNGLGSLVSMFGSSGSSGNGNTQQAMNQGGPVYDFRSGGPVPGKAPVNGDSPHNDIVQARLSPGEIVIPRSLAESKIGKEILKLIHAHNSVKNRMNGND